MVAELSRRNVLRAGAIGVAGVAAGATGSAFGLNLPFPSPLIFHSPKVAPFIDAMPVLPYLRGSRLTLDANSTSHQFHSSYGRSPAFGYGGMNYLGPVIEAQSGEPTQLIVRNRLGAHPFAADLDTTLHRAMISDKVSPHSVFHLHGGVTPPISDGHPDTAIVPGMNYTHHFPNNQDAGSLWYHDHAMGITRLNVYAGLASFYLLRDDWDTGRPDNRLGLPHGKFEVPLVLQEKIFTSGGVQSVRSTPIVPQGSWEGGAVGDVGVVNGAVWPELKVARGLYRFRVINAGSFSVWNLFFSNSMKFWVIGNDAGLLDAPFQTKSLRLAPAERVDILVDFNGLVPGETVTLCNNDPVPGQAAVLGEKIMPFFCRFRATTARGFRGTVPTVLRGRRRLPPATPRFGKPDRVRNVTVNQGFQLRIPPAMMNLNNLPFSSDDVEKPRQGTVEQWNFINTTPDPHPMHLHLVHFRVLGRQAYNVSRYTRANPVPAFGQRWTNSAERFTTGPLMPAASWESGMKDTVLADGNMITRILVRFPTADELGFDPDATFLPPAVAPMDHGASRTDSMHSHPDPNKKLQGYMWHCHILDHEDHEMMLKYRTIAQ